MPACISSILLRCAYRPATRNPLWRLLRRVARALIGADTDPMLRIGVFDPGIATADLRLRPHQPLQPQAESFAALGRPAAVGRGVTIDTTDMTLRTVEPPRELPTDPVMEEWLGEVTEPYILWDSPKPPFDLLSDYFYDYAEPLPQAYMPLYVQPLERTVKSDENKCREAFSSLSNDRLLFTLTPEAVRSRSTR